MFSFLYWMSLLSSCAREVGSKGLASRFHMWNVTSVYFSPLMPTQTGGAEPGLICGGAELSWA